MNNITPEFMAWLRTADINGFYQITGRRSSGKFTKTIRLGLIIQTLLQRPIGIYEPTRLIDDGMSIGYLHRLYPNAEFVRIQKWNEIQDNMIIIIDENSLSMGGRTYCRHILDMGILLGHRGVMLFFITQGCNDMIFQHTIIRGFFTTTSNITPYLVFDGLEMPRSAESKGVIDLEWIEYSITFNPDLFSQQLIQNRVLKAYYMDKRNDTLLRYSDYIENKILGYDNVSIQEFHEVMQQVGRISLPNYHLLL